MPPVLYPFTRQDAAMPLLPPAPEPVPLEEVAAVLAAAAMRARGGPANVIPAAGERLATALHEAGFRVVRAEPGRQLTL